MRKDTEDFPVVGIGASAGGLGACKRLLAKLPADSGAAYILVHHLGPDHDSMMVDLLESHTPMEVRQAEDAADLVPDTVYVIPPGKFIRLTDHGLRLDEPVPGEGVRGSIDRVFHSLAETRGDRAIAIVLTGTGSDGTSGLREIKAAGGMVMAQSPDEAEHDGMPRSAVETGLVDIVCPIDEMAGRLQGLLKHVRAGRSRLHEGLSTRSPEAFRQILSLLKRQTRHDFGTYKKGTIERRIKRRMDIAGFGPLEAYAGYLARTPDEGRLLFRDLLIGVTRFFREPEAWSALAERVIDPLVAARPGGGVIRAWVPGCATGEEAYTLAMTLFDRIDRAGATVEVQIFGTDINDRAIAVARAGCYAPSTAEDIPEDILRRYMQAEDGILRIGRRLRNAVAFVQQNVIADPPFSGLDLISCRNLMIYLEPEAQQKMIETFHFALGSGGHLLLGSPESAERSGRLFVPLDKEHRIYRRAEVARGPTGAFSIARPEPVSPAPSADAVVDDLTPRDAAQAMLMARYVPPSVLVDRELNVRYFHGAERDYLDFPKGKPTTNLTEMALPGLARKLRGVVDRVRNGRPSGDAVARGVRTGATERTVRITAEALPVRPADGAPLILVSFSDMTGDARDARAEATDGRMPGSGAGPDRFGDLEDELQSTREDLQSTIEEMETSNEELKASNEQLETSREELQSLNEELTTVNVRLEEKIEEVEESNNDLRNLLTSTNIAVIFLDTEMVIRRFTPAMRGIMRIIDSDVGRSVEDIASRVRDARLVADAARCLDGLTEVEAEVESLGGRHLVRRVRPFRTSEDRIEGVVVTYTDVTSQREATLRARMREAQQTSVAELGRLALRGEAFDTLFRRAVEDAAANLNLRLVKILVLEEGAQTLLLRAGVGWKEGWVGTARVSTGRESQAGYTLAQSSAVIVRDFDDETRFLAPSILVEHRIRCGASVIIGPVDAPWGVLGAHDTEIGRCAFDPEDIDYMHAVANAIWLAVAQRRERDRIAADAERLRQLTDALPVQVSVLDRQLRVELLNQSHLDIGVDPEQMVGQSVEALAPPPVFAEMRPRLEAALAGEAQSYELRRPGRRTAEDVYEIVRHVPRRSPSGRIDCVITVGIDITERRQLERDLERSNKMYRTVGEAIPFGVWVTDASGALSYLSQSFLDMTGRDFEDLAGNGWVEIIASDNAAEMFAAWRSSFRVAEDWEREMTVHDRHGERVHILVIGRAIRDAEGRLANRVGLNLDITRRKLEEERIETISAELDHRVKNILATVSSVARLTGRTAVSFEDYRDALEARLGALSEAHQLLAASNWAGMGLDALLRIELDPYLDGSEQVTLAGPPVHLSPRSAQSLALAFHELATNAVKHGGLGTAAASLAVSWTYDPSKALVFEWRETSAAPAAKSPGPEGFGTSLLTRIVTRQLDAESDLALDPRGLRFVLTVPSENL